MAITTGGGRESNDTKITILTFSPSNIGIP